MEEQQIRVYKFGGASVRDAAGVRNLGRIIAVCDFPVLVIVSAMGKTTNALEQITEQFMCGNTEQTLAMLEKSRRYHGEICSELFGAIPQPVDNLFAEIEKILTNGTPHGSDYDRWYDAIVSYGELLSTTVISIYLEKAGIQNRLLDMRQSFITDGRARRADIDLEASEELLRKQMYGCKCRVWVGQGFIGGTSTGRTVTLGREGSDYSAAAAAYMLDAESLTIWKDVEGILNADPKQFSETTLIPELDYLDAVELAYSGAQVIHPKTIKPLQNKHIPLYVKPFASPESRGSVIRTAPEKKIEIPVLILRRSQVLVTIRPADLSFVLEERFAEIFALFEEYAVKVNLIQSSAVSLSICVDNSRCLGEAGDELRKRGYRVVQNEGMELLTIRGYSYDLMKIHTEAEGVYLVQQTRHNLRVVREDTSPQNVVS